MCRTTTGAGAPAHRSKYASPQEKVCQPTGAGAPDDRCRCAIPQELVRQATGAGVPAHRSRAGHSGQPGSQVSCGALPQEQVCRPTGGELAVHSREPRGVEYEEAQGTEGSGPDSDEDGDGES